MRTDTDTVEIGDAPHGVESPVCGLPMELGERGFEEPWELRAFAIAIAAYHNGKYRWSEFQLSLIEAIKAWETGHAGEMWNYYEHWLTALETVLADNGVLSEAAIDERTREMLAVPRNADHHHAQREPVAVHPAVV